MKYSTSAVVDADDADAGKPQKPTKARSRARARGRRAGRRSDAELRAEIVAFEEAMASDASFKADVRELRAPGLPEEMARPLADKLDKLLRLIVHRFDKDGDGTISRKDFTTGFSFA